MAIARCRGLDITGEALALHPRIDDRAVIADRNTGPIPDDRFSAQDEDRAGFHAAEYFGKQARLLIFVVEERFGRPKIDHIEMAQIFLKIIAMDPSDLPCPDDPLLNVLAFAIDGKFHQTARA